MPTHYANPLCLRLFFNYYLLPAPPPLPPLCDSSFYFFKTLFFYIQSIRVCAGGRGLTGFRDGRQRDVKKTGLRSSYVFLSVGCAYLRYCGMNGVFVLVTVWRQLLVLRVRVRWRSGLATVCGWKDLDFATVCDWGCDNLVWPDLL